MHSQQVGAQKLLSASPHGQMLVLATIASDSTHIQYELPGETITI